MIDFKSIKRIRLASIEEIGNIIGMHKAKIVHEGLKNE